MAVTADKVVVELELRDGQYLSRVRQNERVFTDAQKRVGDSAENAERRIRASSAGISTALRGAAATIAAGVSVAAITRMADSWTDYTSRVRLAVGDTESVTDTMSRLNDMADRTYTAFGQTAESFLVNSNSLKELGYSTQESLDYVEALNNALVVSGARADRAARVQYALQKAMSSGTLRGEELNTVLEVGGRVSQLIADEMGVTTLQLRKLGQEGKITGDILYRSLAGNLALVRQEAEDMPATIADAFIRLNNAIGRYVGETDQGLSATQRMAEAIIKLSENLDRIIPALAVITAVIGTRYVAAGVAATASSIAQAVAFQRAGGAAVQQRLAMDALIATQGRMMTSNQIIAAQMSLKAGRMGVATAATRALGASMLSLVGGPAGAVIIALGAVALGATAAARDTKKLEDATTSYNDIVNEHNVMLAEQARQNTSTGTTASGSVSGINAMSSATDKATEAMWRLVDAQKEAIRTNIAAQLEANREQISRLSGRFNPADLFRADRQDDGTYLYGRAAREAQRQRLERQNADLWARSIGLTLGLDGGPGVERVRPGGGGSSPTEDAKAKKPKGPTAAELAAMREELRLQDALALAQSRGDEVEERSIQRQIDINALTDRYARAEIANAEARAEAQIDALLANEEISRQVDQLERDGENRTRRRLEGERAVREEQMRQLEFELEISRLSGDSAKTKDLERQLALLQRIAEYGPGREDEALRDQGRLNTARDESEIMAEYQTAARSFVEVLSADNVWESLGQKFAKAAEDNLTNVIADLFAILGKNNTGGFGDLFRLGSSFFGGGRARGGPVRAGFSYDVGENGREKFIAPANGFIMPNMNAAAASPQSSMVRLMVDESAMFAVRVQEISGPIAVQAASTAYNRAYEDIPRSQARRSRQRLG